MLRRILLASAGAMALTGAAFAADLPYRGPPPVYLPPPPVFTWTGLYLGGQLGYKWGNDNGHTTELEFATGDVTVLPVNSNPDGAIGGAHIGYNWQFAQWVLGVEADVDSTNFNSRRFNVDPLEDEITQINLRSTIEGSFRGRLGFAWDRWLLYATGGVAFADFTNDYRGSEGASFSSFTNTRVGWTVGGGIEYAFTPNWLFGVEYRYTDFSTYQNNDILNNLSTAPAEVTIGHHHVTQNRVEARVSYKFDWLNPVVAKY